MIHRVTTHHVARLVGTVAMVVALLHTLLVMLRRELKSMDLKTTAKA